MKKIIRSELIMSMLSWCLFLNNYQILGILLAIFSFVFSIKCTKISNNWRVFAISLIIFFFNYSFVSLSKVEVIYHLVLPFLLTMSLNTALINEGTRKQKTINILPNFFCVLVGMFITYGIIMFIPESPWMPFYKSNLYVFTTLIFFPSFMVFATSLLMKYRKERIDTQKLYN